MSRLAALAAAVPPVPAAPVPSVGALVVAYLVVGGITVCGLYGTGLIAALLWRDRLGGWREYGLARDVLLFPGMTCIGALGVAGLAVGA